jgi:hypothetical protein
VTTNLLVGFDTPGDPRKLALYRGRMLVADDASGLTVASYRTRDLGADPPAVDLVAYPRFRSPSIHESGALLRVEALAADDAVVRDVEFYLDGEHRATRGSHPFAADLRVPRLEAGKQDFTVQARAFDTAGNATWSQPVTIGLTNELRPPFLVSSSPRSGTRYLSGTVVAVTASFNEPMAPETFDAGWTITSSGPDGQPDTADDVRLATTVAQIGEASYRLVFDQPLDEGFYRVDATANLTDLFDNPLGTNRTWEFGIRPQLTYLGPSTLWSQATGSGTNWSGGTLPTLDDFVEIDLPDDPVLRVRQTVNAYRLIARGPLHFEALPSQGLNAQLRLSERAVFEKPVILEGQTSWSGGESDILDSLVIGGPANNSFFSDHILNNYGTITMEKSSIGSGLLLNHAPGGQTILRNHPGAVWNHLGGAIVGTASGVLFENLGRFVKPGDDSMRIDVTRLVNLGSFEIQGGTLQLLGGSSFYGYHQHLGSYRVDAGANLVFGSSSVQFGRNTRIHGEGNVSFVGAPAGLTYPGSMETGGTVSLLSGLMNFSGNVDATGPWELAGTVVLSGLNPRLAGPIAVLPGGELQLDSPSSAIFAEVAVSNRLSVNGSLRVQGPLRFHRGSLLGFGRVRAEGPTWFGESLRGAISQAVGGRFELADSGTCVSNANVQNLSYHFSVLPGATLDLGQAGEFTWRQPAMTNDGTVLKAASGVTRIATGLHNRGLFRVTDGLLDFDGGALIQTAGLTSLSATNIRFALRSGNGGFVDLQGGRLEGSTVIQCRSFTNGAVVAPGLPIGTLDLQVGTHPTLSVYHQTPAATLEIDIAGPAPGTEHDELLVSRRVMLDGTLEIKVAEGYDPPLGQEFTFLTAFDLEGEFDAVEGAMLPGGKRLELVYETTAVKLRVVDGP